MRIVLATLLTVLFAAPARAGDPMAQWGSWRGPLHSGVAPKADPPTHWAEHRNVRWKVDTPGLGLSTPVVWGDRIFLTTAVPTGPADGVAHAPSHGAHNNVPPLRRQRFVALALGLSDGRVLWERTATVARPHESTHETGSWASQSPATDGDVLIASFGSHGLYAYGLDGAARWSKDLGDMEIKHGHGEGSSPLLAGGLVVVPWDHEGRSFLVGLDAKTGAERWRTARDEVTSWSTPIAVEHGGRTQVVVAATGRIRAHDLRTGAEIWSTGGLSHNVVASPVFADGLLYAGSSYESRAMLAIRVAGAKGDLTGTDRIAWRIARDTPYVPSPIVMGGHLCFLRHLSGVLSCLEGPTGKWVYGPKATKGVRRVYASPAAADGRLYVVGRGGVTAVLRGEPPFDRLATNRLDDTFSASPALVGRTMLLRGEKSLYALQENAPPRP